MVRVAKPAEQGFNRIQAQFNAVHVQAIEKLKRFGVGHITRKARGRDKRQGVKDKMDCLSPPIASRLSPLACLLQVAQQRAERFLEVFAFHNHVDHTMVPQKFGTLKFVG